MSMLLASCRVLDCLIKLLKLNLLANEMKGVLREALVIDEAS